MLVSVCMIVRNEEQTLPYALRSTLGLADEVVVVDTGSTDGTLAVAREYGARVLEGGDRRNKAAERNRAADAAHGEWTVVLDADERIADPAGVRAFLEATPADALYIRETYIAPDGMPGLSFPQMRGWRRGAYRYRYRAHELPIAQRPCTEARTEFVWEHRPPQDRPWKAEHLLMLLLMDVDECPGEPRPVYYLGRQYMYIGAYDMAVQRLNEYLGMSKRGEWGRGDAYDNLATCYLAQGKTAEAMQALFAAVDESPRRRDFWGRLAQAYHDRQEYAAAAGMLRTLLTQPAHNEYENPYWRGYYPYDLLARCLWQIGEFDEGYVHAKRACELSDLPYLRANLKWFEDKLGG